MEIDFFIAGPKIEVDRAASAKTALIMHNEFSNVFKGNGSSKGLFLLHIKDDVKPYQMPSRNVTYALQEPFRKEMEDYKSNRYWHQKGWMKKQNCTTALSYCQS